MGRHHADAALQELEEQHIDAARASGRQVLNKHDEISKRKRRNFGL